VLLVGSVLGLLIAALPSKGANVPQRLMFRGRK
jgi:hypothetical protein